MSDANEDVGSSGEPSLPETNSESEKTTEGSRATKREIKGDLAYNSTPGGLERALRAIITAQKPDKVDAKYIQTTLAITGGTGRNQVGTLKKLGIIASDGRPTELYDKFRNDNLRSHAAFEMLKRGYASIFRVNAHAHKATEDELLNIIAQVTGLDKEDSLIKTMYNCFDKVRGFIDANVNVYESPTQNQGESIQEQNKDKRAPNDDATGLVGTLGLNYHINIVLPQSGNIETYDMIFQSLRNNLLDWNK